MSLHARNKLQSRWPGQHAHLVHVYMLYLEFTRPTHVQISQTSMVGLPSPLNIEKTRSDTDREEMSRLQMGGILPSSLSLNI
jgi:hypothetical protein